MPKPKLISIHDIERDDFYNYVFCQHHGKINMYDPQVRDMIDIDRDTHFSIIQHYGALNKMYPDIRHSIVDAIEKEPGECGGSS